jgi:hypothetical protein
MEKLKSNFSETAQTVQSLTRTPLNNMVFDKSLQIQDTFNASRMQFVKRFFFWLLIIILLALYGFNIFTYLAQGTDIITALISPFTYVFALLSGNTVKSTIENSSDGGQILITGITKFFGGIMLFFSQLLTGTLEVAENSSVSAIDQLQSNIVKDKINSGTTKKTNKANITQEVSEDNIDEENIDEENIDEENTEDKSLLRKERKLNERPYVESIEEKKLIQHKEETDPQPLQSDSNTHGYCYIGTQNNTRNCAKVSSRNKCMSGDIFPTMDLCINPTLRN